MSIDLAAERIVRKAELSDTKILVEALASAFVTDPVFLWGAGGKVITREYFQMIFAGFYHKYNHCIVAGADNGMAAGAALWLPPGVGGEDISKWLNLKLAFFMLSKTGMAGAKRFTALGQKFAKYHIHEPHYYLHAIGVHETKQGKGVGGALLAHMLEKADADQVPAYL
jgi:GNAT superfamily N-acetyltransferase